MKARVTDHMDTVNWIIKVINSCVTEEQRKNSTRLAKLWVKRTNPNSGVYTSDKSFDNVMFMGELLVKACERKKHQLVMESFKRDLKEEDFKTP